MGTVEDDQGIWLELISEDLSALMASEVFLVADYMDISPLLAHTHAPSGFNTHCCENKLEV